MSSIINADTTNGVVITSDTSGEIKLQSAGTDTVTVNTSGNVGIGITPNASVKMQVKTATNQDLAVVSSSFVSGGVGLAAVNDAYNAYTALDLQGSSVQFGTGGTERMRIDSSGKVYIGCTSTPSSSVYGIQFCPVLTSDFSKSSAGSTGGIRHIGFYNPNGLVGGIETSGSATIFATSSDYRLKNNVTPMSGSIDRLKQLKPSTWSWVNGGNGEGFLAHEAQTVVPEAVTGIKDEVDDEGNPVYQGIDQSKLVPLLTAALQEAITKIEDLETRIQALENA